jgi:hypothetical protein
LHGYLPYIGSGQVVQEDDMRQFLVLAWDSLRKEFMEWRDTLWFCLIIGLIMWLLGKSR